MSKPHTGIFRVRRGWFGTAILQELMDYPMWCGNFVDASVREHRWEDVDYDNAPKSIEALDIRKLL